MSCEHLSCVHTGRGYEESLPSPLTGDYASLPASRGSGNPRGVFGSLGRVPLRTLVELGHERADALLDVVARDADLGERAVLGVGQIPVEAELPLAGDDRAGVAAAHRDH